MKTVTKAKKPKTGLVRISHRALSEIRPSPENDELYRPVDRNDPAIRDLAESIRRQDLKEPLVITIDGYIVSGHRRYVACKLAGLKMVPVRIEPIRRADDIDGFIKLLATYNKQRVKSFDETVRETLVTIEPHEAYSRLLTERAERSVIDVATLELEDYKPRAKITAAKQPMLDAVLRVIEERRKFWPLSDRQIHYPLLNDPPLRHANKPKSRYRNDRKSYSDLCDLLTRARLAGLIPFKAIADETRPVVTWDVFREPQPFLRQQFDDLCKGYWRDLQQSQPNHIEVIVEKNTVAGVCRSTCGNYCVPMTSGRGFCSLPPRHAIAERYRKSGKHRLILLIVSDFDPEGESIAESLARSMRDDFEIRRVSAVKVALTAEQVEEHGLPPEMTAKEGSSRSKRFIERYGDSVWELEALAPETLQNLLDKAIRSVMDIAAYNREVEAEQADAQRIEGVRLTVAAALRGTEFGMEAES